MTKMTTMMTININIRHHRRHLQSSSSSNIRSSVIIVVIIVVIVVIVTGIIVNTILSLYLMSEVCQKHHLFLVLTKTTSKCPVIPFSCIFCIPTSQIELHAIILNISTLLSSFFKHFQQCVPCHMYP